MSRRWLLVTGFFVLAGCGRKGALRLPRPETKTHDTKTPEETSLEN